MFQTLFSRLTKSSNEIPPPPSATSEQDRSFPSFSHLSSQINRNKSRNSFQGTLYHRLKRYTPPPGVKPGTNSDGLAQDSVMGHARHHFASWAMGAGSLHSGAVKAENFMAEATGFLGYPFLAELSQKAEFRKPCDIIARESTRQWITLRLKPNTQKPLSAEQSTQFCQALETEMRRLGVRDLIRRMVEQALTYGLSHLWINIKDSAIDGKTQSLPLLPNAYSIAKNSLHKLQLIEPVWTTPDGYNAENPLAEDYYRPSFWWVQGIRVHHSRLISMVPYEVSDIFKPSFNFGGLSLTQQLFPYIRNFLRIRNSTTNITANFSKLVLKTSLAANMQGNELDYGDLSVDNLQGRAALLHDLSDGQDTIIADKDAEDVSVISTPLNGLAEIQSQAMKAIASVPGIPLIKLFGIQPSGLNASSDAELRVFYDEINAFQKAHIAPVLHHLLDIIQLNLFGSINPALDFDFVPLWQMDANETATIEKLKAETDALNLRSGKITLEEARSREGNDTASLYRHMPLSPTPAPSDHSARKPM